MKFRKVPQMPPRHLLKRRTIRTLQRLCLKRKAILWRTHWARTKQGSRLISFSIRPAQEHKIYHKGKNGTRSSYTKKKNQRWQATGKRRSSLLPITMLGPFKTEIGPRKPLNILIKCWLFSRSTRKLISIMLITFPAMEYWALLLNRQNWSRRLRECSCSMH